MLKSICGVQITGQVYLGDFHSTDARQDHESFSPIGDLKRAGVKKRLGRLKDKLVFEALLFLIPLLSHQLALMMILNTRAIASTF